MFTQKMNDTNHGISLPHHMAQRIRRLSRNAGHKSTAQYQQNDSKHTVHLKAPGWMEREDVLIFIILNIFWKDNKLTVREGAH